MTFNPHLNLGILAHVDAGKTSLTERLLYAAGITHKLGCVDDGDTQTDTLALERQRGITIKAAVVSFAVGDVTVNLIDTPGHPDFIAEVERALSVFNGAVLADFRHLTPLIVLRALRGAGTGVCEPLHRFRLEAHADALGQVLPVRGEAPARARIGPDPLHRKAYLMHVAGWSSAGGHDD